MVEMKATLNCPHCWRDSEATMPDDLCQIRYQCPHCEMQVTPKEGDCCVFCSYADRKCPPKQAIKDDANDFNIKL